MDWLSNWWGLCCDCYVDRDEGFEGVCDGVLWCGNVLESMIECYLY